MKSSRDRQDSSLTEHLWRRVAPIIETECQSAGRPRASIGPPGNSLPVRSPGTCASLGANMTMHSNPESEKPRHCAPVRLIPPLHPRGTIPWPIGRSRASIVSTQTKRLRGNDKRMKAVHGETRRDHNSDNYSQNTHRWATLTVEIAASDASAVPPPRYRTAFQIRTWCSTPHSSA